MRIKFQRVLIENFMAIGSAEIDLQDRGFTLISGINNCPQDNAASNGSGKTSLTNAIFFALTGETAQGVSKNLANIHTKEGARVELDFEVDSVPYKLIRYKDHSKFGNNLQIFVNGEDKSGKGIRDSEKTLSELLPDITSSFLGSVIILGQGMPQKFADNTPSGRKEVLEKLSKSDFMLEDIKNRLSTRKAALSIDLRAAEDALLSHNSSIAAYERQCASYQDQLKSLEEDPTLLDAQIEEKQKRCVELSQLREAAGTEKQQAQQELEDITAQQLAATGLYSDGCQKIRDVYRATKEEFQAKVFELSAEVRALQSEIKQLQSISDVCPTCGQKLPDVHKVDTAEKEAELQLLSQKYREAQAALSDLTAKESQELIGCKTAYEQQQVSTSNALSAARAAVANLGKRIDSINAEFNSQNALLGALQAKKEGYEQRQAALQQDLVAAQAEIEKLQAEIVYITLDRDDAKARLEAISKMTTIATRDFRGFLLTNVIDYLNKQCKSYSFDVFKTELVDLTLEGNNLNISYDGKLYENLSGGEQRKLDIIVQFALSDMLKQMSGFSSSILVLDEIFDGLDAQGCDAIVSTITKRLLDVESIFIVTHRANLMIPADSTITVVKGADGISTIQ